MMADMRDKLGGRSGMMSGDGVSLIKEAADDAASLMMPACAGLAAP